MTHVSPLEVRELTAMLTTLPYISFKSYCPKINLYLILFMGMLISLKLHNQIQQIATMH